MYDSPAHLASTAHQTYPPYASTPPPSSGHHQQPQSGGGGYYGATHPIPQEMPVSSNMVFVDSGASSELATRHASDSTNALIMYVIQNQKPKISCVFIEVHLQSTLNSLLVGVFLFWPLLLLNTRYSESPNKEARFLYRTSMFLLVLLSATAICSMCILPIISGLMAILFHTNVM